MKNIILIWLRQEFDMNKSEIIDNITKMLQGNAEILFAYVFGSFVRRDDYHDIDIAVYLKTEFDKNNNIKFPYGYESGLISELNRLVRKEIDFVVMNNADITLQQRIINKGRLLFSKNDRTRLRYENYIRKLYIDAEQLRKVRRYYL
jgi:predicted nucleotidyltransferase